MNDMNDMNDIIRIRELKVYAHHGYYDYEKKNGQYFYVNCDMYVDTRIAGISDDLNNTVNYGEIIRYINEEFDKNAHSLIESVAERIARDILVRYSGISNIMLEIRKPNAPIDLEFDSISVVINRGWNYSYIGLGSNIGNRESYIREAINKLQDISDIRIVKVSELINTKPYGLVEQEDFLNGIVLIKTLLRPQELLDYLSKIEIESGRKRTIKHGPRTLDLDILFYNDEVINSDRLVIPHADIANREFVLESMVQLDRWYRHPSLGYTMEELLNNIRNANANK